MDFKETGLEGVDLTQQPQDRDRWQAPVNTVISIVVKFTAGNFLAS
jgi:hypothetical protein